MRNGSYVFYRKDTGSYFFRWVVPSKVRPFMGGRREVKKSLHTDQRRLALSLARRLSVLLERTTSQFMANRANGNTQDAAPASYLFIKLLERTVDGSIRMEGLELDPAQGEEERKHLAALLGVGGGGVANAAASDARKLADLVNAFFEEGDRAKSWTSKTRQELEAIYALALEILGAQTPLASLGRKDFARLKEMLARIPTNRSKDPRYRGKSALELAGMDIPKTDLMSVTTINKYIIRVGSVLKWGVLHGYLTANYAEGMTVAKSKRADEEREPMPDADVLTLKDASLKGLHGSERFKWLPLIGMYSGLRITEAAQLELSDFGEIEGIPVISINNNGQGKRLKNANSRRTVPVHPELVRLGLLEHVTALRKRGSKRLFPELPMSRDGFGHEASKAFSRFRNKLGLKDSFHSLRHSVATKLREADVSKEDIGDLLGHSRGEGQTASRYMKAASAKRLHEALSKLSYAEKPKA